MTERAGLPAPAPKPMVPVACCGCGADDAEPVVIVDADYEYLGVIDDAFARRPFRFVRCRRCGREAEADPDAEDVVTISKSEFLANWVGDPAARVLARFRPDGSGRTAVDPVNRIRYELSGDGLVATIVYTAPRAD